MKNMRVPPASVKSPLASLRPPLKDVRSTPEVWSAPFQSVRSPLASMRPPLTGARSPPEDLRETLEDSRAFLPVTQPPQRPKEDVNLPSESRRPLKGSRRQPKGSWSPLNDYRRPQNEVIPSTLEDGPSSPPPSPISQVDGCIRIPKPKPPEPVTKPEAMFAYCHDNKCSICPKRTTDTFGWCYACFGLDDPGKKQCSVLHAHLELICAATLLCRQK